MLVYGIRDNTGDIASPFCRNVQQVGGPYRSAPCIYVYMSEDNF